VRKFLSSFSFALLPTLAEVGDAIDYFNLALKSTTTNILFISPQKNNIKVDKSFI